MSDFQNIPIELTASSCWLVWKLGAKNFKTGRPCKLPCNPHTAEAADKVNPDIWLSFEDAVSTARKDSRFAGIGLLPMGKIIGFDLDKCRDKETREIEAWAKDWIARLKSYTEVSPSGEGLRIFFLGEAPAKAVARKDGAEVYANSKQFLTVTGKHLEGTPLSLRTLTKSETAEVFERVRQGRSLKTTAPASPAPVSQKLQRLLEGDISAANTTDLSAAVQSCLTLLAIETIADRGEMESQFKASKLYLATHWKEKWERLRESELDKACANAREYLKKRLPKKAEAIDPNSWRQLFRTFAEESDLPFGWLVKDLIEIDSATALGGLSGHGKTLLALSLAKSLVLGTPFLNHFEVPKAYPVLYLIPESGSRSFRKRLRSFRLTVDDDRFLYRTLSHGPTVPLSDPRMLLAAKGRVVFLDTAIRFMSGDENSSTENQKYLAQDIFNLQAAGAVALVLIHHSPKAAVEKDVMTLENVLRGSGDIGAMLSNVYGVRRMDERTSLIHIERVKGRDMDDYLPPFQVEGRPWIDQEGDFRLTKKPGDCGSLKEEKLSNSGNGDLRERAWKLKQEHPQISAREAAKRLGVGSHNTITKLWALGDPQQPELKIEEEKYGM